MRLHHFGFVGAHLPTLQRRLEQESVDVVTPLISDPTQRVVVQFFRDRITGGLWEIVLPLTTIEESPLAGRLSRGGGLDHVCYELEERDGTIENVVASEQAAGARVTCAPVYATAFDRRIAFVLRRSGRLIEYVEARRAADVI